MEIWRQMLGILYSLIGLVGLLLRLFRKLKPPGKKHKPPRLKR